MVARFAPRLFQATRGYASQAAVRAPKMLDGLAGKYASSAYVAALSKDSKTLEKVEADLKAVQSALSGSEGAKLKTFIENPTLSGSDRTKGIDQLLAQGKAKADPITHNLFTVLAENGRLGQTEKVIEGFQELMTAYRGEVEVTVTSATALDKSTVSRIESALKGSQIAAKGNGKSLKIVQKVNPAIQGGLVVDFAGNTVDLSVASKVNKLNALLEQGV
ncbi:probable ATP5 - F1F0-ATPase complex, OSCP subunit [Melanopsichium pennsylvanicum]|uniref:ATP synthase subunit 5, mitochondrial n=1 Tax=Melanopsichium pennsylvanicum TaxID=63383 RepID=A0AAJ4XML8_9BASI|nr:probable ATP5 - F1F0-ATPase complex, OSCP subunit [Melanopsichium pennsylvanicum]